MDDGDVRYEWGAHEHARFLFLESLSKEQAAHITELQSQVAALAAQATALTALLAVPSKNQAGHSGVNLLGSAEYQEGLAGNLKIKVKVDDLGALPSEDLGSPALLRAVLVCLFSQCSVLVTGRTI